MNNPRNKNPGPGAYDPYAHECLPNIRIGERLEGMTPDKKPGPGTYDTDFPSGAPEFTVGYRLERKRQPGRHMHGYQPEAK